MGSYRVGALVYRKDIDYTPVRHIARRRELIAVYLDERVEAHAFLLRVEAGVPCLLAVGAVYVAAAVAHDIVHRALGRAVKKLVALCREGPCKGMLVPLEEDIEPALLDRPPEPRVSVIILTLGHDGVYREVICAELPCFIAALQVVIRPALDLFGGVYAHDKEVGVAVVKRNNSPSHSPRGRCRGRRARTESQKKIGVLKIEFADRLGEIRDEAAVIVVARRHHIWQALDYPL